MISRRLLIVGALLVLGGAVLVAFGLVDRTRERARRVPAGPTTTSAGAPARADARADARAAAVRLRTFGEVAAHITDPSGRTRKRCLLAARTEEQRARGLMQIRDRSLDGHDGMVFLFTRPERIGFWMRNTPMPLSIAYFGRTGHVVSVTDMAPCADTPSCPTYTPATSYTAAIEVPRGRLPALGIERGAHLAVGGACPG